MTEKYSIDKLPKRILASVVSSVSAGVVPRSGAPYIAIGRKDEIAALLSDLELVSEGGGAMRFLIGRYGSGKSFLIQLIRGYALERDFLTADCDLSPERRLYGTAGTGLATYRELIKNLASKSSPEGDALSKIIARWIFGIQSDLADEGITEGSCGYLAAFEKRIRATVRDVEFMVGGFDFAKVIGEYYAATAREDENTATACLRWLRGEYSSRTEARRDLGFDVSCVINDQNWYDFIKLWAALAPKIGYRGLIVFIDECVNLYKIPHRISRENNYEKILSMFNDTLQGKAAHLGIVFGGTPQFLEDTRRGLFGYEALRSRLCDSRFSSENFKNFVGPVIRLARLSDDELLALVVRMTALHGAYYNWEPRISSGEQIEFLKSCLARAGADSMITPREMLRDYMTLLNILLQNPTAKYEDVAGKLPSVQPAEKTAAVETSADGAEKFAADARPFDPNDIDF